jgi:hypothetical protein
MLDALNRVSDLLVELDDVCRHEFVLLECLSEDHFHFMWMQTIGSTRASARHIRWVQTVNVEADVKRPVSLFDEGHCLRRCEVPNLLLRNGFGFKVVDVPDAHIGQVREGQVSECHS